MSPGWSIGIESTMSSGAHADSGADREVGTCNPR